MVAGAKKGPATLTSSVLYLHTYVHTGFIHNSPSIVLYCTIQYNTILYTAWVISVYRIYEHLDRIYEYDV